MTNAALLLGCLLLPTGHLPPADSTTAAIGLAENMVTQLYVEPLDLEDAELETTLDRLGDEYAPIQLTTNVVLDDHPILEVLLEIAGDTITFLAASGPLFAAEAGAAETLRLKRRHTALAVLESLNGWSCDPTRRRAAKPHLSEARCRDSSPPPFHHEMQNVLFDETCGLLRMVGTPGPPPVPAP